MAAILSWRLGDAARRVPTVELPPEQVREAVKANPALREAANRLGQVPVISARKARDILGWMPRDTETTIVDTAVSLLPGASLRGPSHQLPVSPAGGSTRPGGAGCRGPRQLP
jgi:hypothetical protein